MSSNEANLSVGLARSPDQAGVSVVFAGGGCRTFWGLGAMSIVGPSLEVRQWAGVSAGAAMAIASSAGVHLAARDVFVALVAKNPQNFYPRKWLSGQPLFPHASMYRAGLSEVLALIGDSMLRAAPPTRILLASFAPDTLVWSAAARAVRAYRARRRSRLLHGPSTPTAGLNEEVFVAQEAGRREDIVEAVMCSSATPPVTGLITRRGRRYIDGGLIDNVPVRALCPNARAGRVLVVLSKPRGSFQLPRRPDRFYIAPSKPIAAATWDYTDADLVKRAYDQGVADAIALRSQILDFVS